MKNQNTDTSFVKLFAICVISFLLTSKLIVQNNENLFKYLAVTKVLNRTNNYDNF